MFFSMYRYHRYEFHCNKGSTLCFWLAMIGYFLLFELNVSKTVKYNQFEDYHVLCQEVSNFEAFVIVCYLLLNLPVLVFSIIILQVKRNDDLLSGISKLDYLLKISIFQRNKGPKQVRETIDEGKATITYRNMDG